MLAPARAVLSDVPEEAGGEGGVGADLGGGVGKGGENEGEEGLWVEEKGGVVRVD